MVNLYNNIENLCLQNGTNITQMCAILNITRSTMTELKSGRTKDLSSATKIKIAKYFHVSAEYLDKEFENIPCPLCGLQYVPNIAGEIQKHNKQHKRWQEAVKKFGFCWSYVYREEAKARARNLRDDHLKGRLDVNLTIEELAECYEIIYKSLYSRAVEHNNFSLESPSFNDYIAGSLAVENFKTPEKGSGVYEFLVNKYGVKEGVLCPGTTEFAGKDNNKKSTNAKTAFKPVANTSISNQQFKVAHFGTSEIDDKILEDVNNIANSLKEDERKLLAGYRELNDEGKKQAVIYVTEMLLQNIRYTQKSDSDNAEEA